MNIVASQGFDDLVTRQGTPTAFHWRWYYSVPSLALWVLILLLLILVRGNHSWQAWLILLPPLAVMLFLRMSMRLVSLPPDMAEQITDYLVPLATAWTSVWLLGHWFAGLNRILGFFLALAMMFLACSLSVLLTQGMNSTEELGIWLAFYGVGCFTLMVSTTFSGVCCRGQYRPRVFMAWMIVWMVVVSVISMPVVAAVAAGLTGNGLVDFFTILVTALIACLIFGGVLGVALYAMNLPFMLLATGSPFFRERFRRFFHLTQGPLDDLGAPPVVAFGEEL